MLFKIKRIKRKLEKKFKKLGLSESVQWGT